MAKYIGNIPSVGEFKKLDSLTSTFNGSLTQFNLEYGSTSVSVGDASQLIVSLNGIIQEPLTAYTLAIGGSAIVFSSAPASTDTCHIILLGGVGGTSTVADGAVTASKLDSSLKDYLEETYTANGSQTTYTLTRAATGANTLLVTIDGVVQPASAFSVASTTLTISPALPNGTDVRVVHLGIVAGVYVPADDSVTVDMLANSINTDIASKLPLAGGTVTGNVTVNSTGTGDNGLFVGPTGYTGSFVYKSSGDAEIAPRSGKDLIFADSTGGTELVRIKSNGNVGVGTSSPAQKLHVYGNSGTTALAVGDNGLVEPYGLLEADATNNVFSVHSRANYPITFKIANTERLRIDSSGKVSIGSTNNGSAGSLDVSIGSTSLSGGITLWSPTASEGGINFGDGYTGTDRYRGSIAYNHSQDSMKFLTSSSEAMRIDSSGNLLVGTTTLQGDGGVSLSGDGYIWSSRVGGASIYANRTTTDGSVIEIRKDGSTVGSIGTSTGLYIASTACGLRLHSGGTKIFPTTSSGSAADGTVDLGAVGGSWKDAYLSGGVYLGGTGSANKLDDYEEGTWTPAVYQAGFTISSSTARYTKIGRLVTVTCDCDLSGTGNGNDMKISGLPFTSLSAGHASGSGYTQYYPSAQNGSNAAFVPKSGSNDTFVYFQNGNGARYDGDRFQAGFLNFTITYFTS